MADSALQQCLECNKLHWVHMQPNAPVAHVTMMGKKKQSKHPVYAQHASRRCHAVCVQVLTTGSWPTQTATTCTLPREVETACSRFQDFYLRTHTGRKLSWQTNMGNAGETSVHGIPCALCIVAVAVSYVDGTPKSLRCNMTAHSQLCCHKCTARPLAAI